MQGADTMKQDLMVHDTPICSMQGEHTYGCLLTNRTTTQQGTPVDSASGFKISGTKLASQCPKRKFMAKILTLSEYHMTPIKPGCLDSGNEELAAICVGSCVGH